MYSYYIHSTVLYILQIINVINSILFMRDNFFWQQPSGATGVASGSALSSGASPSTSSLSTASVDNSSSNSLHGSVNSILRVIIENMLYPITIDVLHQVNHIL